MRQAVPRPSPEQDGMQASPRDDVQPTAVEFAASRVDLCARVWGPVRQARPGSRSKALGTKAPTLACWNSGFEVAWKDDDDDDDVADGRGHEVHCRRNAEGGARRLESGSGYRLSRIW